MQELQPIACNNYTWNHGFSQPGQGPIPPGSPR